MTKKNVDFLGQPIKNGSISKLVFERLKESLINKELKPGEYLPSEAVIAGSLKVSKSSVREAVKMLEALGVVEIKRGLGTVVRKKLSNNCFDPLIFQLLLLQGKNEDLIELRAMFERGFTYMALEKATKSDLLKIKKTIDKFEENFKRGVHKPEDDIAFHYAILYSTNNPYIIRIGENLIQLFWFSIKTAFRVAPETAISSHKRIYKAIKEKNREDLSDALSTSLGEWEEQWLSQL